MQDTFWRKYHFWKMKLRFFSPLKMLQRKNCFRSLTRTLKRTLLELTKKSSKLDWKTSNSALLESNLLQKPTIWYLVVVCLQKYKKVRLWFQSDQIHWLPSHVLEQLKRQKIQFLGQGEQRGYMAYLGRCAVATQPYPLWQIVRKKSLHIVSWL